jgi:thiamine pyrophosphate-dependent acetolactate synthase large subunit-like protein
MHIPDPQPKPGAQALVESLLRCGINSGFGIPSIHNIGIYECLRQTPPFQHWVVRHEQAAGFAADGFYRQSGRIAAIFASTGPGNLFTLVPLLESLQSNTPVLLIGTNIASALQASSGGGLHETPNQLEILRPLTRYARRVNSPEEIQQAVFEAAEIMCGTLPGPAFIEIPHDLLAAPVNIEHAPPAQEQERNVPLERDLREAVTLIAKSSRPAMLVGSGIGNGGSVLRLLAEHLQSPVFTTTSGKGRFPDDHPLALGCISRLATPQQVFHDCDLLISFGARLTEFDTGRFGLRLPKQHIRIVANEEYAGTRFRATLQLVGDTGAIASAVVDSTGHRQPWCDAAGLRTTDREHLQSLNSDAFNALGLLREALSANDVVTNDQSILNYWASAFFPVFQPGTFLYPYGSGTLGYGLPAAVGAACAIRQSGEKQNVVCIAGDGGFQYTMHELATIAQYCLPVKILLVNDNAYGIIGFLQHTQFGHTHEVALKNPDVCQLAGSYGISSRRVTDLSELKHALTPWLAEPGPALLEWQTQLKSPWEAGAIPRPGGISRKP